MHRILLIGGPFDFQTLVSDKLPDTIFLIDSSKVPVHNSYEPLGPVTESLDTVCYHIGEQLAVPRAGKQPYLNLYYWEKLNVSPDPS